MLRLTQLFNITGHPAIALPAQRTTSTRFRAALQIVGRRHQTDRLLEIARRCEPLFSRGPSAPDHAASQTRVLSGVFHAWERRLAAASTDRIVRPFEWGLDWVGGDDAAAVAGRHISSMGRRHGGVERAVLRAAAVQRLHARRRVALVSERASTTPHAENNTVRARYFPERSPAGRKRAVIVLPQWNADAGGHVGLCRLLNRFKISALRLSLPYHDARMPPELRRADYIVSANIGRTAQVCRQAVLDARRGIAWLASQGYESIGILGTSLGSCLAMLTAAHEPLARGRPR